MALAANLVLAGGNTALPVPGGGGLPMVIGVQGGTTVDLQWSADGVTWTSALPPGVTNIAGVHFDFTPAPGYSYRFTAGATNANFYIS